MREAQSIADLRRNVATDDYLIEKLRINFVRVVFCISVYRLSRMFLMIIRNPFTPEVIPIDE